MSKLSKRNNFFQRTVCFLWNMPQGNNTKRKHSGFLDSQMQNIPRIIRTLPVIWIDLMLLRLSTNEMPSTSSLMVHRFGMVVRWDRSGFLGFQDHLFFGFCATSRHVICRPLIFNRFEQFIKGPTHLPFSPDRGSKVWDPGRNHSAWPSSGSGKKIAVIVGEQRGDFDF